MTEITRETIDKATWEDIREFIKTLSKTEIEDIMKACDNGTTKKDGTQSYNLQKARQFIKKTYFPAVSPVDIFKEALEGK